MMSSLGLFACQGKKSKGSSDATEERQKVSVPLSIVSNSSQSLALASNRSDVVEYSIDITGCASGYTASLNNINGSSTYTVDLFLGDQNCVVELTSLELASGVYATPFSSYAQGSTYSFVDGSDADKSYLVTVDIQLPSTIVTPDPSAPPEVRFLIEEIQKKADTVIDGISGAEHLVTVEHLQAPDMTIPVDGAEFLGLDLPPGGAFGGQFQFTLDCGSGTDVSVPATPFCGDVDLSTMEYVLVKDDYSDTITYAEAETIFTVNSGSVATGVTHVSGDSFETSVLIGPDAIVTNPNMLLILRSVDADNNHSYTYFNIDVSTNLN